MSVRLQLIVALVVLTVVPLAGLTLYSHYSSQVAFRRAVEAEAGEMAAEMRTRVDAVKNDLDRRLHTMDLASLYALTNPDMEQVKQEAEKAYQDCLLNLGSAAPLVESIEVRPCEEPAGPLPAEPSVVAAGAAAVFPSSSGPVGEQAEGVVLYFPGAAEAPRVDPPDEAVQAREFRIPGGRLLVRHHWKRTGGGARSFDSAPSDFDRKGLHKEAQREMLREFRLEMGRLQEAAERNRAKVERLQAPPLPQVEAWVIPPAAPSVTEIEPAEGRGKPSGRVAYFDFTSEIQKLGHLQAELRARVSAKQILASVMQQAEFKQGEIPFAIDRNGRLFTLDNQSAEVLKSISLSLDQTADSIEVPGQWLLVSKVHEASGIRFGIARPLGEGLRAVREAALRNFGYGVGIIGIAILGILPLSKRMTRNLTSLSRGAQELAAGNFDAQVPVRSQDEFGQLATTFNRMAQELKQHQSRVVEQERLKKELEMCRQIQEEMLPRVPLRLPFAEVQGVSIPAREVGGDFFNYFSIGPDRLAILIGDVSGKGVAAALLMANIQATLRARLPLREDLDRLVAELDREVGAATPMETYLTLFIGIVDAGHRRLSWVNAGHNTQYVIRGDSGIEAMPSLGRPVGLLPGSDYAVHHCDLRPGDCIFLYTDGLVEAENGAGEEYGNHRLEALLQSGESRESAALLQRVGQDIQQFRAGGENGDDATMLILNWADPSHIA